MTEVMWVSGVFVKSECRGIIEGNGPSCLTKNRVMQQRGKSSVPSPLEVMLDTMNENRSTSGMTCQIKRRLPDGSLIDADARALGTLGTKSRMAYAAQNLKQMKPAERTAWALEMKDYANKLYAERDFKEAMEKYVEALAASNFGNISSGSKNLTDDTSKVTEDFQNPTNEEADFVYVSNPQSSSNIDSLIIPVLCNLAACCIELKEFAKALKFSDSAIELRPRCGKALMRRGMALVHIGEYIKGIQALQSALDVKDEGVIEVGRDIVDVSDARLQPCMIISETDRYRIPVLIDRAERGRAMHQKNKLNQANQMKKVFGSTESVKKHATMENSVLEENMPKGDVAKVAPSSFVSSFWALLLILILAVVFVYL